MNFFDRWLQGVALVMPFNNIFAAVMGLSGIILFVKGHWRELKILDSPINKIWGGLSLWMIFTVFFAFDRDVAILGLLDFLPFLLFTTIVSYLVKVLGNELKIAESLVLSSLPVSVFGLFQVIIDRPQWQLPRLFWGYPIGLGKSPDGRITSLFGHFNELGIFLVMILPFASYFLITNNKKDKLIPGLALFLALICLFFSGSRNAWAMTTIGLVAIAIFYRFWWGLGAICVTGTTLIAAVWLPFAVGLRVFFPSQLIDRLLSTFDSQRTDFFSTAARVNAWQVAMDLISQNPIVGWGLRNFPIVAAAQGQELYGLPHEHNLYFSLMVGMGVPGFGLFVIGMAKVLGKKTEQTPLRFAYQCSIGLFLLSGMLDITLYEPRISLLFWLLVGVLAA